MSRKVDLNAPRNSQNDYKKSHNNHSFSHARPTINSNVNNDNSTDNENSVNNDASNTNNNKSTLGQRVSRLAGFSKSVARTASNYTENMNTSDKIKAVIKFAPPQVKVVLMALIIGLPLVGVMLFVVLFSNASATGISDYISLAETCSKITVTDTGCDSNGNNCTHEYDGEVDFEDYIAGVVAGLGDGANNTEFYKTIAIVARTYFLENASSDCQVFGNSSFMEYKSIDVASDRNRIKDAVKDTSKMVLVNEDNELVYTNYSMACVVNNANNSYYLRYGINENNYQKIDASFDSDNQIYSGKLNTLYNSIDKSDNTLDNRTCPLDNDSNGLSLVGALYLATNENYNYEKILNYYYGNISVVTAQGTFNGNQVDGFINPVAHLNCCTSPFGCRLHPVQKVYKFHSGLDIGGGYGVPIYAAKAGKVSSVRSDVTAINNCAYGYGNYIDIDHMDGTKTRYAHLQYGGIRVSVGDEVQQGQNIALMGSTGCSTGAHLHYEVIVNGTQVSPYNYIDTSEVYTGLASCNKCARTEDSVDASYCGR